MMAREREKALEAEKAKKEGAGTDTIVKSDSV